MSRDWNELISAYIDNELTPEDRQEFERQLAAGNVSSEELDQMRGMKRLTGSMQLKQFPDQAWDRYWEQTYNRLERNLGLILLSISSVVLLSFGAYQFLIALIEDQSSPWWVRVATGGLALGLSVLFVSVVRERLFIRKHDRYRGVKR